MAEAEDKSSDSDDCDPDFWSIKKRQKAHDCSKASLYVKYADIQEKDISKEQGTSSRNDAYTTDVKNSTSCKTESAMEQKFMDQQKKFDELKKRSNYIRTSSSQRRLKTEERRSKRLIKRALKDPFIREMVENPVCGFENEQCVTKEEKEGWGDIKPFLTINNHIQGPIPHGDCGPKTELECIIENAIKEGDFEKAELLSDTLANREFAVKITTAFAAKRCQEKLEEQKAVEKEKRLKKIRWTFDAKERWQMKGNM